MPPQDEGSNIAPRARLETPKRTRTYSDLIGSPTEQAQTQGHLRSPLRPLENPATRFERFKYIFKRTLALAQLNLSDANEAIEEKDIKELGLCKENLVNAITELEATLYDTLKNYSHKGRSIHGGNKTMMVRAKDSSVRTKKYV